MEQEIAPRFGGETYRKILVLAVVTPKHSAEVERILSHTAWQPHIAGSVDEGLKALRSLPVSVVLCEDRLPDGKWLDLLRETERLCPRPEVIVLSECADTALWGEVLNCGGYDVLATPLEPRELYALIPMAWRRSAGTAEKSTSPAAEQDSTRELTEV